MFRALIAPALLAATALVPTAVAAQAANPANDRLMKLSPEYQRAAMRQAVTNNNLRCGRVDRARFQQPYRNLMMWTVGCTPGGDYAVFVGRDQTVQARPCADLPNLRLPACRK